MNSICTVTISGNNFESKYEIRRLPLYYCSLIFQEQMNQNLTQNSFKYSNSNYDKNIYDLFFSLVVSPDIVQFQFNQNVSQDQLQQLSNFCQDIQASSEIKKKVSQSIVPKGINFYLDLLEHKKPNRQSIEKSIISTISKDEIVILIKSKLSNERKVRIFEKLLKTGKISKKEFNSIIQTYKLYSFLIHLHSSEINILISQEENIKKNITHSEMEYLIESKQSHKDLTVEGKIAEFEKIIESQSRIISKLQEQLQTNVVSKEKFEQFQENNKKQNLQFQNSISDEIAQLKSNVISKEVLKLFQGKIERQNTQFQDSMSSLSFEISRLTSKAASKEGFKSFQEKIERQNTLFQNSMSSISSDIAQLKSNVVSKEGFKFFQDKIENQNTQLYNFTSSISSEITQLKSNVISKKGFKLFQEKIENQNIKFQNSISSQKQDINNLSAKIDNLFNSYPSAPSQSPNTNDPFATAQTKSPSTIYPFATAQTKSPSTNDPFSTFSPF